MNLYGPLICEFCRKRTSEQDAMEITQEVFWRVFRYVKGLNYDPKLGSFGGWIGQITRNEIRHHIERRHRDSRGRLDESVLQSIEATATLGEWEDEYNAWVVRRAMQQVRDEVSECTWNLFAMTTSGATPQEAAEQMNVKISRVYKARWMIAERLRRLIRSMADDYPFAKQE